MNHCWLQAATICAGQRTTRRRWLGRRKRKLGSAGRHRRDGGRTLRCGSSCHQWGKATEKRSFECDFHWATTWSCVIKLRAGGCREQRSVLGGKQLEEDGWDGRLVAGSQVKLRAGCRILTPCNHPGWLQAATICAGRRITRRSWLGRVRLPWNMRRAPCTLSPKSETLKIPTLNPKP